MKKPNYHDILRAAKERKLDHLKLTADQLADIPGKNERTGLHVAAGFGCLNQIVGGATAGQLEACLDTWRTSALYVAVSAGHMLQIQGGVTAEDLANTKPIADFALGMVSGTARELSCLTDDEFRNRATAVSTHSRDIPQKTGLHWVARHGGLNRVIGGVTFEHLNGLKDSHGNSALAIAAQCGHLDEILGGVTAEQMASVGEADGLTALHVTAINGHLDQIKGGVTFAQLTSVADPEGNTPLHMAAMFNSLDQIKAGVTADQLAAIQNHAGQTGLHAAASYKHVKGGVTVSQLAAVKDRAGQSGLHVAAYFGCLDQVEGGVTADMLAAAMENSGNTALHLAAVSCCLDQLKGGATITQLSALKNSDGQTPLDLALADGHLFELFNGDREVFWNRLNPAEQSILRTAMKNQLVPESVAKLAGSGQPGFEPQLEGGFPKNMNVQWDCTSPGNLAVTQSLAKLELCFPMSKQLVCRHCQQPSRIRIQLRHCRRHYCPRCGAVHIFDADIYEQEALKCLTSMRRVFPWTVRLQCTCGTTFEHEFVNRDADTMSCPQCGQGYQHAFAQEEQRLFDWLKIRLANGHDAAGWTALPPRSPMPS